MTSELIKEIRELIKDSKELTANIKVPHLTDKDRAIFISGARFQNTFIDLELELIFSKYETK
jgi:hypothetical protein